MEDSLDLMKLKKQLQTLLEDKLVGELLNKLPSGYSIIGDIAIFRHIDQKLNYYKQDIGNIVIDIDPQINVVVEQFSTDTNYRKPQIIHLAGEKRTTTKHKEYSTIFNIDVAKITFSPGNKGERGYLINTVKNNEIIVDMFACAGNLSLPIVKNNSTVKCYGIEMNVEAYSFLVRNIEENKIKDRYFPILGDNRDKTPKDIASRVLMGYFECDIKQLSSAVNAINGEGWIHYHTIIQRGRIEDVINTVTSQIKSLNCEVSLEGKRQVKKFSPRLNHYCFDYFIQK
ncbi:MAG: class I SAM-dependent methyltransferase [Candidatus Heimdallarchaeaceae archaeon]